MTNVIIEDKSSELKMDKPADYRDRVPLRQVTSPVESKCVSVMKS